MSDPYSARDLSEEHSSNPSSNRKGKSTHRDGRSKAVDHGYDQDDRMPDKPPIYYPSRVGHSQDTSRTLSAPNPRTPNDVGHYPSEQQKPLSVYSVAPLAPYPLGGGQYAVTSESGNTTTTASESSFNQHRTAVKSGNLYNGTVSSTSTVINVFNIHSAASSPSNHLPNPIPPQPLVHPSQSYKSHSDHSAPPAMRPSVSDPYDQRGDARYRSHSRKDAETRPPYQSKPSNPYNEQQTSETVFAHEYEDQSGPLKRDKNLRHDSSGRYKESSPSLSPQYPPNPDKRDASATKGFMLERLSSKEERANNQDIVDQPQTRRPRQSRKQREAGTQDWSDEDEETSRERIPRSYINIPQQPRMGTLPTQMSNASWTGKDGEPLYGSPSKPHSNISALQTSSESVLTVQQGNLGKQWPKNKDNDPILSSSPERGSIWTEPRNYGQGSPNAAHPSGDPVLLSSIGSTGSSRSTSLPTSYSPSSQRRQNSQSGRPTNQEIQDTPPYSAEYGLSRDPRDQGRPTDLQNADKHISPERVTHPVQHSQGGSWHGPDSFPLQGSSRGQSRQEDTTHQNWTVPSNQMPPGRIVSSTYSGSGRMDDGRPTLDQSLAHFSSGFQYPPPQMAPGPWLSPYGPPPSSTSSSIYPGTGGYSQDAAGHPAQYQIEISQRMAQTSLNHFPRGPLTTIPEAQQQSFYANTTASSHISRTSFSSTIPDKYISFGNPRLRPLREKRENEGRRRKKPLDAESHISIYMASDIIDQDTTPLWSPFPKLGGRDRQRRGVEVGDLGYMDESGEFTTIFNIFYPHEVNLGRGANPPPYHHYQPLEADRHEAVKQFDIQRRHFYLSENIRRHDGAPPEHFQFSLKKKSGRSGAIIVLPHGGSTSTLRSRFFQFPHVKQYFRENAASWYQHAHSRPDIPSLPNGALLFVQGTHLARTWGIATFLSKQDVKETQRISFFPNDYNPYEYQWDWYTEKWKFRTGPSAEELSALHPSQRPPPNQCIGIIASSVLLDDQTWQTFFSGANDRSPVSLTPGRIYNPLSRLLRSRSSLSSIKVNRPPERSYLDSIAENQRVPHYGNDSDYDLFR